MSAVLDIPVYSDDHRPVATLSVDRQYIDRLAKESGLTSWIDESVGYYVCVDGAVVVMWGEVRGITAVHGVVVPLDSLQEESEFKKLWRRHRAFTLTVGDVHDAILQTLEESAN